MSELGDDAVKHLQALLRIDTTNPPGNETPAAEYLGQLFDAAGLPPQLIGETADRKNVIVRHKGTGEKAPLLLCAHLDVVPAEPESWKHPPFGGEIHDGYIWGRGAIDMKDMDAMTLAIIREWQRTGRRPPRDIVLAFVSDEEAGGGEGAHYLVDNHRDLFADCTEAISEVGGFSVTLDEGSRVYLIQTAEKGINWLRLKAAGRPGHGSMVHPDNAVTRLAAAVSRIGNHEWPIVLTDTVRATVEGLAKVTGRDLDADDPDSWLPLLGSTARIIGATIRNTSNPTMLEAGYKNNVIPGKAEATIDARFLPGQEDALHATLDELLGEGIEREFLVRDIAVETHFEGALVDAMAAALRAEDPDGTPLPYLMFGGTDAKSFSTLGIRCFGFSPLLLPPELDFTALFHGIDERVPVEGLKFGVRVLDRLLSNC
jgi:acetylornithine deacetylase/succinyl-diaminopimelate desuccinylase-like protein